MSLLEARGVRAGYGDAEILGGVDVDVEDGQLVVLVGPNGAGKSTLMKAVFGLVRVHAGTIRFAGDDITNAPAHTLVRRGISYVPQEQNVFRSLTVRENLDMGAYIRRDDYRVQMDAVFEIFPRLAERRNQPVGQMSGGERQMVAIGRALMVEPRLLMLDEPTAGLSPRLIGEMFERIRAINRRGPGILMVEQNARAALEFADRGYVLATGRNRFQDSGPALLANRDVVETFLGG